MNDEKSEESSTVRKVYVFPRELADRIAAFQQAKKLPSEVEAVRRLLDEALLHRDTADDLLSRFAERLKLDAMPASVSRDLLVGHPLIEEIRFPDLNRVIFKMKGFGEFSIRADGAAQHFSDYSGGWQDYDYDPIPF